MDETDCRSSGTAYMRIKRPQELQEALARCMNPGSILFSKSVCHVDEVSGSKFVLTTTDGDTFECLRVIMAVPLPNEHIDFGPVFEEPGQWVQGYEPSNFCVKTVLIYDQPWWRTKGLSGHSQNMHGPIRETHDALNDGDGVYSLTCIIAGDSGNELWNRDLIQRREAILVHLRDVFSMFTAIPDPILRIEPKDTLRIRWASDIVGLGELVGTGGQEANSRVYFAGFEANDLLKARL